MARIPMTGGFTIVPEGVQVFRIYDVNYDETFGKIFVKMVNAKGLTHTERFTIKNKDDELNEKALGAFSFFAKTAMGDFGMDDVDPDDLVGKFIRAEVVHTKVPSTTKPGETRTFVNLGEKSQAEYFDTEPVARALTLGKEENVPTAQQTQTPAPATQTKTGLDLDSLLG